MTTKLSQEIFALPYDEDFIVYAPLRGIVIQCDASMVNFLQRLYSGDGSVLEDPSAAEVIDSLHKTGLLIADEELKQETTLLERDPASADFSPTRVTFLVTTNCNLRVRLQKQ